MTRFKLGDRCRVIKNILSPNNVGYEVTITQVAKNRSNLYKVKLPSGTVGIACEECLELITSKS